MKFKRGVTLKILFITSYYYPNMLGGTEHSVKLLAEGLKERGHEVFVISSDKKDKETEIINGVHVYRFNLKYRSELISWKIIRKAFEFRNYFIKNKLEELLDHIKPDIIHTNSLFYLSPIVWKIANKRGIKVVHTLRDYWGICPKCTLLKKDNTICTNKNILCKLHQLNYESYAKYVDYVTAPSEFTLKKYKEHKVYIDTPGKMVSNAIDFDVKAHSEIVKMRNERNDQIVNYLFIGSLETFKGIEYLIEAFKNVKLDNIRLNICGVGKLTDHVKELIKDDNRIQYLGRVDNGDKEKVLLMSDVMIVPSIWYEPFGRVVIEGYKYALPVIGTDIGGISELLDNSVSIGVSPGVHEELEKAIIKLSDRSEIKKYLNNFSKTFDKYKLSKQLCDFEEIYKNI